MRSIDFSASIQIKRLVVSGLICFVSAQSHAQDCDSVLNMAFNTSTGESLVDARSEYWRDIERATRVYEQTGDMAAAEASIIDIGSGAGEWEKRRVREDIKNYRETITTRGSDYQTSRFLESSLPSSDRERAIEAWENCIRLQKSGVNTIVTGNFDNLFVVSLNSQGANSPDLVIEQNVDLSGSVRTDGTVAFHDGATRPRDVSVAQNFVRTDVNKPFSIIVQTNFGAVILYGNAREIADPESEKERNSLCLAQAVSQSSHDMRISGTNVCKIELVEKGSQRSWKFDIGEVVMSDHRQSASPESILFSGEIYSSSDRGFIRAVSIDRMSRANKNKVLYCGGNLQADCTR